MALRSVLREVLPQRETGPRVGHDEFVAVGPEDQIVPLIEQTMSQSRQESDAILITCRARERPMGQLRDMNLLRCAGRDLLILPIEVYIEVIVPHLSPVVADPPGEEEGVVTRHRYSGYPYRITHRISRSVKSV